MNLDEIRQHFVERAPEVVAVHTADPPFTIGNRPDTNREITASVEVLTPVGELLTVNGKGVMIVDGSPPTGVLEYLAREDIRDFTMKEKSRWFEHLIKNAPGSSWHDVDMVVGVSLEATHKGTGQSTYAIYIDPKLDWHDSRRSFKAVASSVAVAFRVPERRPSLGRYALTDEMEELTSEELALDPDDLSTMRGTDR